MLICRSLYIRLHHQRLMNLACCQWFHVSRQSSQKKKWTGEKISSLQAWSYATDAIYGPLVKLKKAKDTVSTAKHKTVLAISADDLKLNDTDAAVEFTTDSETDMAFLPCSVSRHVSFQTVSEYSAEIEPMSPAVISSFNSGNESLEITKETETKVDANSKHKGEHIVYDARNRKGTYGYTWVDSVAQSAPAEKRSTEENTCTATSFTQTAYTSSKNVKRTTEQSNTETANNTLVSEIQTDRIDAGEQNILSFPLFDSPLLPAEPVSLSTRFPSVSAILKATMPPEGQLALARWEQRMIAELGVDGFKQYQTALFANGSNLHAAIHQYLSGKPEEEIVLLPANDGHWRSIASVLNNVTDVVCLEKFVRHTHLQYCGFLDCVAEYRGEQYVIDWKTSKRRKSKISDTFDNPLQLVAYLGAYNIQPSTPLKVERCMLVIGYEDGSAADVHLMSKWDCLQYWSNWLHRLHDYRTGTDTG